MDPFESELSVYSQRFITLPIALHCTLNTFHAVFATNYEAIQFAVYTWQLGRAGGGGAGGGARHWWQVDWHWQRQVAGSLVA